MNNGNITQSERQAVAELLGKIKHRNQCRANGTMDPKLNQLCREGRKLLAANPSEDIWLTMDQSSASILVWLMEFVLGGVGGVETAVAIEVANHLRQQLPAEAQ